MPGASVRGEGGDQRGEEQRRHEAEAAHGQPEEDRRRQDEQHAAPGDRPDRLALDADRLDEHDEPEQDQHAGQHQREIAGPHAERRADLQEAGLRQEEAAEADEDRGAKRVGRVDGDWFHGPCLRRAVTAAVAPYAVRADSRRNEAALPADPFSARIAQARHPNRDGRLRASLAAVLRQSAYWPAASMIGFQRAISPSSLALSAAGVASARWRAPCRARRSGRRRWGPSAPPAAISTAAR